MANSFEKSGTSKYFTPSIAPSKNTALISRMMKKKYGSSEVTITTFPEVLTPFFTIK